MRVGDKSIADIIDMPIEKSVNKYFSKKSNFEFLTEQQKLIAKPILKEIEARLFFLYDVGLTYLTLSRDARTISGGEAQRIRIASQIGLGLLEFMYGVRIETQRHLGLPLEEEDYLQKALFRKLLSVQLPKQGKGKIRLVIWLRLRNNGLGKNQFLILGRIFN